MDGDALRGITGGTSVLALIGHPVSHSLSPAMHNASFQADRLDYVYVSLDVDPAKLPAAVRGMAALKLRGFNVTMPHKQAVASLVDESDESATISGAANTVVIEAGKLRGYNTDGGGMVMACKEAKVRLAGSKAMVLGAGGAAAAIANALGSAGIEELHIVNRSEKNAANLRDKLQDTGLENVQSHPLDILEGDVLDPDIVVNATSLGMKDSDDLPVPEQYIQEGRTFCDAVYRPGAETALIRLSRERGSRVVAGDRMLLYQGVLAQKLWTGREPNVDAMDRALRQ